MKHDINLLAKIADDVACGHQPDDSYTHEMTAMWHRISSELAVFRREVPGAYVSVPVSTEGMPDVPNPQGPGTRNDDFDESQHPRDEAGKFAPGGTGERKAAAKAERLAKEKAKFGGTTGRNNEMKRRGEKAAAKRKENAQAKAAREAGAEKAAADYRQRNAEAARAAGYNVNEQEERALQAQRAAREQAERDLEAARVAPSRSMLEGEAERREGKMRQAEMEERFRERKQAEWEAEHLGQPYPAQTLSGQAKFADMSLTHGAAEAHERLQEAIKNNAKLGEHAEPESNVRDRIQHDLVIEHEREIAKQEVAAKAQAAVRERQEKVAAAQKRAQEADNNAKGAAEAEREARERWLSIGAKSGNSDKIEQAHREFKDARRANEAARQAQAAAQAERDALKPRVIGRGSSESERAEMEQRQIVEAKHLGGGINGTYKVVLDDGSKGTFKPAVGESGARTNVPVGTYYQREAAVSRVAPILGVEDLVPAAVVHDSAGSSTLPAGPGSLHSWAEGNTLYDGSWSGTFDRDGAERMRVADYVLGGSDRHARNVIVSPETPDGRRMPIMIDNGLSLPGQGRGNHYGDSITGEPDRFIQPWDHIPHDTGLLPSTHSQIQGIDTPRLVRELHSAGIDRIAIEHVALRAEHLKTNPELLAVENAEPHNYTEAWDHVRKEKYSAETQSKVAKIMEGI